NGIQTYNPHYEYGFTYGGLYVLGFCNWIYRKAKEQGVEKILFLARDGDIYTKVFNKMFSDMPNEYVYWSRIANLKYTAEHNRSDFLRRLVEHKAHSVPQQTLKNVLSSVGLYALIPELKKHNLQQDLVLTQQLVDTVKTFLIDNYDKIVKTYEKEAKVAEDKFRQIIGKHKKVAVVDVGWLGSGPMGIKWLVEEKWKMPCEVKCYMAASSLRDSSINIDRIVSEDLETYMFSPTINTDLLLTHLGSNRGTNNMYFELFTQACHPSFAGFCENGEYKFDVPEIKNYPVTKEIQRGIVDFANLYLHFTKHDTYLRNITGSDAYMPFRFVSQRLDYLMGLFSNVSFSMNVGVNVKGQKQETLGDINKVLSNKAHSKNFATANSGSIVDFEAAKFTVIKDIKDKIFTNYKVDTIGVVDKYIDTLNNDVCDKNTVCYVIDDVSIANKNSKDISKLMSTLGQNDVMMFVNSTHDYIFYDITNKDMWHNIVPVTIDVEKSIGVLTYKDSDKILVYSKNDK
ncbi:MAG: hypothetical protein J6V40_04045, partial [Clostridia bacterium]|nr:hypothetical protein [Clostridia bacterium]